MRHVLLALVFLLNCQLLSAQTLKSFPAEPEAFVKEMVNYMKATKRDDDKAIVEKFEELVETGAISSTQLEYIINTSNVMLGHQLRANPHFRDYLTVLAVFAESKVSADKFAPWSVVLDSVILSQRRGSSKEFTSFLEFSYGLFSQNAIFTSKLKDWKIITKDWTLAFNNGQPYITVPTTNLIGVTTADSTTILNTSGTYYPLENTWVGKSGKTTWEKAGYDASKVYAEFGEYVLPLDKPEYKIDSVTFYHKDFFDFPLQGVLEDKVTAQKSDNYPQFRSYRDDLPIDDFGPNIKFIGGFSLQGNSVVGTGGEFSKAHLDIYQDNGKKAITLLAQSITIKKGTELYANEAEASIYFGEDSIYHPGLTAKYLMERNELSLYTGDNGIAASNFYDSYHNVELSADAIIWKTNEPTMSIKMMTGAGEIPVNVWSENYFRKGELDKYATGIDFNPISVIKMYSESARSREIYAEDLAKRMNPKYTESTIKAILFKMVEEGFIYYNTQTGVVTVKDKVFNYVFANADLRDYDIIRFSSFSTQTNGVLHLDSNIIRLEGVKMITLSDSQDVRIFPGAYDIELHKDQDIKFSNIVMAGIIDFVGTGFYFDYDSFRVDLTDLASATINVPTGELDKDGDAIFVPLKSKIEGLTGYLDIDVPNNKAGREPNPEYPIFTNREKSYVYYMDKAIHDSAYIRDRFYFELDPFSFDSLITFDPYLSDLEGRLFSADIFPTFEEKLRIQDDLSLGFRRSTPDAGYDIYKGKGHYTDSIFLSNAGLRGEGHVDYLFTNFASDSILFTPDSLNAIADSFHMDKTTHKGFTYPLVDGRDNDIHWLPYSDSMYIRMRSQPFAMYGDGSELKGNLLLTINGLKGDGAFEFNEASLVSAEFNFESEALSSDTMAMQIKSIDEDKVTFNTPNVSGRVDFNERIGEFKSNETDIATEFSNNFYKTEINEFFWDMDANILDFKSPPGSEGSYFISTRSDQDSLKFLGTRALFNMTTSIIDVTGVPYVLVADAKIVPDSGHIKIMPGGSLDSLSNAIVWADTVNSNFKWYEADIVIDSKREYHGKGLMDYVYEKSGPQPVMFSDIHVVSEEKRKNTLYTTVASTTIAQEDSFLINDGYQFWGKLALQAENPHMEFEGTALLNKFSDQLDSTYAFTFTDRINPDTAIIHFNTPVSEAGDTLAVGLYFNPLDSISHYVSLMSPKHSPSDINTLTVKGITKYDSKTETYYFGDEERLNGKSVNGKTIAYNTAENTMRMEGPLNLNLTFNPIEMVSSGSVDYWVDSAKFVFNSLIGLNLPVDKALLEMLGPDINAVAFDRPAVDYTSEEFRTALANLMDTKKAEKTLKTLSETGIFERPKELSQNIVISNVQLLYDPYYQIYRSIGPISLSYVGETGIHKQINGYLEFGIRQNNDFFNLYLESTFDDWYYISYRSNTLQMASSKEDFAKLMATIDPDKRKIKLTDEEFFFYTIGTYGNMQAFLQRMKMIESGERVEFDLETEEDELEDELEKLRQELLELEGEGGGNGAEDDVVVPNVYDPRQGMDNTPPSPTEPETEQEEIDEELEKLRQELLDVEEVPSDENLDPAPQEKTEEPAPVEDETTEEPVQEEENDKKKKGKNKGDEENTDNSSDAGNEEPTPNEETVEETPQPEEKPMLEEMLNYEEDSKKKKKKKGE